MINEDKMKKIIKNKSRATYLILSFLIITSILSACQTQTATKSQSTQYNKDKNINTVTDAIEGKLAEQIAKGTLLAVYENPMKTTAGADKPNFFMIKNEYDKDTEFKIALDCDVCDKLEADQVAIPAGSRQKIMFNVFAGAIIGRHDAKITVKDSNNNFYASADIAIVVS
jgi:hypothetical protein